MENRGIACFFDQASISPSRGITKSRSQYTYSVGSLADGERETVCPRYGHHNRKEYFAGLTGCVIRLATVMMMVRFHLARQSTLSVVVNAQADATMDAGEDALKAGEYSAGRYNQTPTLDRPRNAAIF